MFGQKKIPLKTLIQSNTIHYIGPVIIKWKNKSATLSEQVNFGPVPTVWHFYFSILL